MCNNHEPIRAPHRAERHRCPCGRKALFVSHAPRSDGRVRCDEDHVLCFGCHRRERDRARALVLAWTGGSTRAPGPRAA